MNDLELKKYAVDLIKERGVTINQIAELTYDLQKPYVPEVTMEYCVESIESVLAKREVINAVITGIELDKVCEQGALSEVLTNKLMIDEGLYGIDEILALSIVNVYGSIGFTNFGYIDKVKPKILGEIDKKGKEDGVCNTFLDDIVGAIAAAGASRVAHNFHSKKK